MKVAKNSEETDSDGRSYDDEEFGCEVRSNCDEDVEEVQGIRAHEVSGTDEDVALTSVQLHAQIMDGRLRWVVGDTMQKTCSRFTVR